MAHNNMVALVGTDQGLPAKLQTPTFGNITWLQHLKPPQKNRL